VGNGTKIAFYPPSLVHS